MCNRTNDLTSIRILIVFDLLFDVFIESITFSL